MSATIEVSRTTLEAMAEILRHILATQPAVSPHPPAQVQAPDARHATPAHSLRDVMATCAMQGIWAAGRRRTDDLGHCQEIARIAYHQADCMLWQGNHGSPAPSSGGATA